METVVMVSCALVMLLQLLHPVHTHQAVRIRGVQKLELVPTTSQLLHGQASATNAHNANTILRSALKHRDSRSHAKTPSERFLDAVKRSRNRVNQLENYQLRNAAASQDVVLHSELWSGAGEYVMEFSLGTPPQTFSTIVDTGSDLCWLQCVPCRRCIDQPDALFDPKRSSTYTVTKCADSLCKNAGFASAQPCGASGGACNYSYGYGDGSVTRGVLAFDTVTLGASAVAGIGVGCGGDQEGTFAGADGVVGLGQGVLSLPSQLAPSVAQVFSYCLVAFATAGKVSSAMTFGDAAEHRDVAYTPLLANPSTAPTYYYVGVEGISIGGQRVDVPGEAFRIAESGDGGVILDTGTTISYWRTAAFAPILAAMRKQVAYPETSGAPFALDLCYDVTTAATNESLQLPSMTVHFTGVDFAIPEENLFAYVEETYTVVCLAMAASDRLSVIGNIQLQNNLIVHDVANRRVGFKSVRCGDYAAQH